MQAIAAFGRLLHDPTGKQSGRLFAGESKLMRDSFGAGGEQKYPHRVLKL
jgi:hypothetical protein